MKYRKPLLAILLCLFSLHSFAEKNTLNLYNWANYMPPKILHQFEKETGIHINYMEFDSNETMYAKLRTNPKIGFDIVIPSSYYIPRMIRDNLIQPLDKKKIPNIQYLNPALMRRKFDPDNNYSIPFSWGITGVAVNKKFFNPKNFSRWRDFWHSRYKNQLLMLNDMREVFAIALIKLGYSVNETNPKHIKQAYHELRRLLPNIKLFNSDAEQNIYVDADAVVGMGWNGDIYQVQRENQNVVFVYPQDPFTLWIDCLVVPKYAPHLNNAYKFLNFINRPQIAAKIARYNGYSSPNQAAVKLLPKADQNNRTFNPPTKALRRGIMEKDVGPATEVYQKYWELLKLG